MSNTIQHVPADKICAGLNDRETFNRSELEALAANIAANGLLQPPVYRALEDGRFQIVAGERRTRAMRDVLAWPLIPALVQTMTDEQAIAAMGSENRCRVQLNPIEEAKGYQGGMARFGWDVETTAKKNGVSTRVVKDRLALLALCEDAQQLTATGNLTPGYALVLALAGLDRNFQNRALDLLKANKSPNLDWWRATVADLQVQCQQNSLFDLDSFMSGALEAIETQNEVSLPDPDTAEAPMLGETPIDVLTNQAAWWSNLAGQYQARGKRHEARVCRANARNCKMSAELIARMAPAPVVMAPVVEMVPVAPVALPDDIIAVEALTGRVGRRTCDCGQRATHELVRRVATGDGQRKSLVKQDVCNSHLPAGFAPLVGAPAQQLTFQAVAA